MWKFLERRNYFYRMSPFTDTLNPWRIRPTVSHLLWFYDRPFIVLHESYSLAKLNKQSKAKNQSCDAAWDGICRSLEEIVFIPNAFRYDSINKNWTILVNDQPEINLKLIYLTSIRKKIRKVLRPRGKVQRNFIFIRIFLPLVSFLSSTDRVQRHPCK